MADDDAFFYHAFFVKNRVAHLTHHFRQSLFRPIRVVAGGGIAAGGIRGEVFEVGKINVYQPVQQLQSLRLFVSAAVADDGDGKPPVLRCPKGGDDLGNIMGGGDQVDVPGIFLLQLQKDLSQAVDGNVFSGAAPADGLVLAVDAF